MTTVSFLKHAAVTTALVASFAANATCPGHSNCPPPNNGGKKTLTVNNNNNPVTTANAGAEATNHTKVGVKTNVKNDLTNQQGQKQGQQQGQDQNQKAVSISKGGKGGKGGAGGNATIAEGAVKTTNTNVVAPTIEGSHSTVQTGPTTQALTIEAPVIPKPVVNSAIAPTIIDGDGGNGAGATEQDPYANCPMAKDSTLTGAITFPGVAFALGRKPPKEYDQTCIKLVDKVRAENRLERQGPAGQAVLLSADLVANPHLQSALTETQKKTASCDANPAQFLLTGKCPTEKQPVTELVFVFVNASGEKQEVRESELKPCPPGQKRDPATLECKNG